MIPEFLRDILTDDGEGIADAVSEISDTQAVDEGSARPQSEWATEALAASRARLKRLQELRAEMAEGNNILRQFLAGPPADQWRADAREERALILALLENPRVIRRLLERLEAEGR